VTRLLDRRLLLPVFVVYLAVLTFVVLQPDAGASGGAIDLTVRVLHRIGFSRFTEWHVEKALNVALFVPLGALGRLLWRRRPWWLWGPVALALSGFFEAVQARFLPDRVADRWDLVTNTGGGLLGAAVVALVVHEVRLQRRPATSRRSVLPPSFLVLLAAGVVVVMVALVLGPTAELPSRAVLAVGDRLREAGAPERLTTPGLWEKLLNVALFVPVGAVAALVRPGWSLLRWGLLGFAGSLAIELTQGALLPGRDASFADLATNTTGMLLGAGVIKLGVAAYTRLRRRPRTEEPVAP
jgi:glycopeptide antibiotics resistance protein